MQRKTADYLDGFLYEINFQKALNKIEARRSGFVFEEEKCPEFLSNAACGVAAEFGAFRRWHARRDSHASALRIKDLTSLQTGQCNMPPAYCDYEFESLI